METRRFAGSGRLVRGVPALAAVLVAATLAGGAPARAAAYPGSAAPRGGPGSGVISTVAGGVGGPGRATLVAVTPCGVSFGAGHVYVSSFASVRKVDPGTDRLTTPAGTGVSGPLGDGRLATRASVSTSSHGLGTCGAAVDHSGNLVLADAGHSRIRVVAASTGTFYGQPMTAGNIYTVAGHVFGFAGDGGPATSAKLNGPAGVAVDAAGNLLIADRGNARVRVVAASAGTFYGKTMTAGNIYTIAGSRLAGFSGDGGPATSAELSFPQGVTADAAGNLLIADTGNNRIRVVAASAGTFYGKTMTAGNIYTIAGGGTGGLGDRGPATSAVLSSPLAMAADAAGNVLIADSGHRRVRVVAASTGMFYGKPMTAGNIYTLAGTGKIGTSGDGGPATGATLTDPEGVVADANGNVLIADTTKVRLVAAGAGTFYGKAMAAGNIYTVAGNGMIAFSGDGGPATSAELNGAIGVAADAAGNLAIADPGNNRVRVAAASTGTLYGKPLTAGNIYTIAGSRFAGFSGDGGPGTSAKLKAPDGVAADPAGNVLIADTQNARVRVVAASTGTFYGKPLTAGNIYTIAGTGTFGFAGDGGPAASAELNFPKGVAVSATGNLVIADTSNARIRVVPASTGSLYGRPMTGGNIYTIAGTGSAGFSGDGGPGTSAELNEPPGAAVDAAGNVVIADADNARIRVVAAHTGTFYGQPMTGGNIYTIAGTGTPGFSGDGGPATGAELSNPAGAAVDATGNVVIADAANNRVRVVAASTGTFYGKTMTAGDIYTIAGKGVAGFSGDGGPATGAELNNPLGVAVAAAGGVLIADFYSKRIREVAG